MAAARCDGHQGFITVRVSLDMSGIFSPMLSLAHLLRQESKRTSLLRAFHRHLELKVKICPGDPPPTCRVYLALVFKFTLLRSASKQGGASQSAERKSRIDRLWAAYEEFALVFNGYVDVNGNILIFIGERNLSRMGAVELAFNAVHKLWFQSLPGVPAENRWTSAGPYFSWALTMICILEMGANAWTLAFEGGELFDDAVSELNLKPEELFRILSGKC